MKKLENSVLAGHTGIYKGRPTRTSVGRPSGRSKRRGALFPKLGKGWKFSAVNERIQQIPCTAIQPEYESLGLLHLRHRTSIEVLKSYHRPVRTQCAKPCHLGFELEQVAFSY